MAIQVVLAVTAIVLFFGSAGLFLVRWNNPLLRGLGWISGSFAFAGAGATILFFGSQGGAPLADRLAALSMLCCFVLLDVAAREAHGRLAAYAHSSSLLVALQTAVVLYTVVQRGASIHGMVAGPLLMACQSILTATVFSRTREPAVRAPALLCAVLLYWYGSMELTQSVVLTFHPRAAQMLAASVPTIMAVGTLASVLGIAFNFFWMTTATFTSALERDASTDPLTRVFNRRCFLLWCDGAVAQFREDAISFSILIIDIDHFKAVNDRYGHAVGDLALCAVVERVQNAIRGIDVLCRWGGEEFSILLPKTSSPSALIVAERVRSHTEQMRLPLGETGQSPLRVTVSVGSATFLGPGDSVEDVIARADEALYTAKRTGRNRTVVSTASIASPAPPPEGGAVPGEPLGELAAGN